MRIIGGAADARKAAILASAVIDRALASRFDGSAFGGGRANLCNLSVAQQKILDRLLATARLRRAGGGRSCFRQRGTRGRRDHHGCRSRWIRRRARFGRFGALLGALSRATEGDENGPNFQWARQTPEASVAWSVGANATSRVPSASAGAARRGVRHRDVRHGLR